MLRLAHHYMQLYKELLCPLDDFELLTFDAPNGQAYSFCPFCYNNPTLEGMEKGKLLSFLLFSDLI
jgi:hypothetical protein